MKLACVAACVGLVACRSSSRIERHTVSKPSCGITIEVVAVAGSHVDLRLANVTEAPVEVGSSNDASFIDTDGAVMSAKMRGGWFMPFELPGRSHRDETVVLSATAIRRESIGSSSRSPARDSATARSPRWASPAGSDARVGRCHGSMCSPPRFARSTTDTPLPSRR